MSHPPSRRVRTFCLIFGVVEALGAALWCLAGAGIYGSPLAGMDGSELAHVWAFLLSGPFSAFLAGMVALRRPRLGAVWLIGGGAVSGILALPFLLTDAFVLPLALTSVPMILIGRWMLRRKTARFTGN